MQNNAKCGLKCSAIFFFSLTIISIINILFSFSITGHLSNDVPPSLSEELQKEVKKAYITVENKNILVEFFSICSFILTLFCGISNLCFYNKVKKNEDERDLNQLLKEANKSENNIVKNYPKNDENTESLGDNLFEQNNN